MNRIKQKNIFPVVIQLIYKNINLFILRCPFCKKVRAFLDFSGLSYDVVEVNPVTKQQCSWSAYKKVPIVVVKVKEGYQVYL